MRIIFSSIILCLMLVSAQATSINVPGDYGTIAAALTASVDDDTITLDDGTYAESLYFTTDVVVMPAGSGRPVIRYNGNETNLGASWKGSYAMIYVPSGSLPKFVGLEINGISAVPETCTNLLYADNNALFDDCVIHGTKGYIIRTNSSGLEVTNCEIYDGKQGIYFRNQNLVASGCELYNLTDGFYLYNASICTVSNNIIHDCDGGIGYIRGTSDILYKNNLIYHNVAGVDIYSSGGQPGSQYINNTIIYNTGTGMEIAGNDSACIIMNNIIYGNGSTDIIAQNAGKAGSDITYNLIGTYDANLTDTLETSAAAVGNLTAHVPVFVDSSSLDFHQNTGSPGIDAGNPDGAYNDLDASRNNMGAYGGPVAGEGEVPVELSSFAAAATADAVKLTWTTATETANLGFHVLKSVNGGTFVQINVALIQGAGTTALPQAYSYIDAAGAASYMLEQIDMDGSKSYSAIVTVSNAAGVTDRLMHADDFALASLSNGSVVFTLPYATRATVSVMNADGMVAATQTGLFNGTSNIAADLAAGMYFVQFSTAGQSIVKRMIVVD